MCFNEFKMQVCKFVVLLSDYKFKYRNVVYVVKCFYLCISKEKSP